MEIEINHERYRDRNDRYSVTFNLVPGESFGGALTINQIDA